MLLPAYPSFTANAFIPITGRLSASDYVTIPEFKISANRINTQGTPGEIAVLLQELSQRVPLSGILRSRQSPHEILRLGVLKWLKSLIDQKVDTLLCSEVDIFQSQDELQLSYYRDVFRADAWILRFHFNGVNYRDFELSECLQKYETEHPGLGSYILHLIGEAGFDLGTPSYVRSIASYAFWGSCDNEIDYVNEHYEEDEREEMLECVEMTAKEYDAAFPAWALNVRKKYDGYLPPEIVELADFSSKVNRHKLGVDSQDNAPCVLLWGDSKDVMEITMIKHEEYCMNGEQDFQIHGRYWELPIHNRKLRRKTLDEIEEYLRDFYRLLGIIRKLKTGE